jgi:hypothetical protein
LTIPQYYSFDNSKQYYLDIDFTRYSVAVFS